MHVGTTLQRTPSAAAPLWEQAFAAWAWRHAVGPRPVHVEVGTPGSDGADAPAVAPDSTRRPRLLGADAGTVIDLGEIGAEGRTVDLADPSTPAWLWVEEAADGSGATWSGVRWWVDEQVELPRVSAIVPTFRREDDATAQAHAFAAMPFVARVLVIDQGGTLAGHAPFTRLLDAQEGMSADLPDSLATARIELLEQPNLGGSGGYARGMLASLDDPSQAVFLSDDDALISEESLRRLLTFQALAEAPTILGTGLLDADSPAGAPTLLTEAEHVERRTFFWRSADGMHGPLDLAGTTPADWDALLPRTAADYTGWWGTLLPPGAVGTLGLPAPFFLKWDDAEYGLRASASGYSTMVLPGASVTHPSWDAYRTQMSWSARILHRNRLATAAAHRAGRGVLADSLAHQLKHVLSGLHLTARLWDEGARAALAGPEAWLGRDLGTARADGQAVVDAWRERQRPRTESLEPTRTTPFSLSAGALRALARALSPVRAPRSVLEIPASEVSWRTVLGADAVIITSARGERIDAFAIEGHDDRSLLLRVLRTHVRLALRWGRLRRRYARALPRWTTAGAWREILERAEQPGTEVPRSEEHAAEQQDSERQSTEHESTEERTDESADASPEGGR
ncbi:glycosyltransferase [Brachybacterium kimchii]|uniref:Glycosyltransferase n=1 Tax=Brachybacterium kimchii TaxID=2942909 RepID=A0ABY4N4Q1_9MICO|nr:glycosyltransferase [Brachybacterium kimchii]UQN28060.1 glycosyltransferase [Brachybacterium kimchii]